MRNLISILLLTVISYCAVAQDTTATDTTYWQYGGFAALNINQASFVNWAAGGENSFSATFIGNFFSKYAKGKLSWENNLDVAYGVLRSGNVGFRKNEDKIDYSSKLGYKAADHWFYTGLLNWKTQFAEGFNFPDDTTVVSRFMAPGYILVSAGIDYKPVEYFSLFMSPATGKFTFVLDQDIADAGTYGNDPAVFDNNGNKIESGDKIRAEFGAYLKLLFQKDVIKNVNLKTQLEIFNNYTDPNKENRKNFDINWETTINMKINDYLATSLILHMIYDHDIEVPIDDDGDDVADRTGARTQFKQVLGIGLSYKFNSADKE